MQQHSHADGHMSTHLSMMVSDMESRCITQWNKWFGSNGKSS